MWADFGEFPDVFEMGLVVDTSKPNSNILMNFRKRGLPLVLRSFGLKPQPV